MNDNYQDLALDFEPELIYTTQSIPTREFATIFNDEFEGCSCSDVCTSCKCINSNPKFECNQYCSCESNCSNKKILQGPIDCLFLAMPQEDKGVGTFTNRIIDQDSFICEYAGEYLTEDEASQRFKRYNPNKNYLFWINEHYSSSSHVVVIDPTRIGNIGRFINHSCDPNCYLQTVRVNNLLPRLCIYAKRTISENEEVTFDYGVKGSVKGNQVCKCGSAKCRGFLPYHDFDKPTVSETSESIVQTESNETKKRVSFSDL